MNSEDLHPILIVVDQLGQIVQYQLDFAEQTLIAQVRERFDAGPMQLEGSAIEAVAASGQIAQAMAGCQSSNSVGNQHP